PIDQQVVGEELQTTRRDDAWIELPDGSGSRVSRVGEARLPRRIAFNVEPLESAARQVSLAAHFDLLAQITPRPVQSQRDGAYRAHVWCDVLAARAVAARRAADEKPIPITQRER